MDGETFGQALRRHRQERRLSLRKMQALTRYDFTYLGQVERGEKPGSLDVASMCDRVLRADGQLLDVFRRAGRPIAQAGAEEEDSMRRRTLIKAMAASPITIMSGLASPSEPRLVSLERDAESLRRLYHGASSPQELLSLASNHLDANVQLLRDLPDGSLKRRALRNRSEVATLAGRLTFFDLQQPTHARGYFGLAHEAATQTDDHLLAAAALGHLAFIPAAEGSVSAGIDYLAGAMDHARQAQSPLFQSWIGAVTSELLTVTDPAATLQSLDQASAALASTSQVETPSWFDYYSADRLDGFRGRALLLLGRHDEAREDLSTALNQLMPSAVKQRAVFQFDVASSYLSSADPELDQACDLAIDAARGLAAAGYATGGARLHEFCARLQPWQHDSVVADFEERLVELTR